jgi:hypothetical protein
MSIFAGLGKVPMPGKGAWFTPGVYLTVINRCKQGDGHKGPYIAVEATVLEVRVPTETSLSSGEPVSWVLNMRHDSARRNLKGFLGAACKETDPAKVDDVMADQVFGGDGTACAGLQLVAHVVEVPTKSGGVYTKVSWIDPEEYDAK